MAKALQSKAFPHAYLRIDGSSVSAPSNGGGGTVNCQSGVADFETFEEEPQPDGTIALASAWFANVHLRMDGSGMKSASDSGAGSVNCQFGVGPWEKFHKRPQPDGAVAYESAAFPGVYLRMDASTIGEFGLRSGGGRVNCQFGVGPWEKFLEPTPPFPTVKWPTAADAGTSAAAVTAASSGSGAGADSWDDADAWDDESGGDYIDDAGGDFTNSTGGTDDAGTWEDPVKP
jgi:hypothetical protein